MGRDSEPSKKKIRRQVPKLPLNFFWERGTEKKIFLIEVNLP